jgi:protein-tyrosine-phosphatase
MELVCGANVIWFPVQAHGIDVSAKVPRLLTQEVAHNASLLITMGCGEACPFVPGLERLDWPLTDPKGKTEEEVIHFSWASASCKAHLLVNFWEKLTVTGSDIGP